MGRLNIMAKGNLDLRDTLHIQKLGDQLVWNGINEILRQRHSGLARVRHETWTRSDALLESDGTIPDALIGHDLPLGSFPLASQFGCGVFDANPDLFVLTIQPDIGNTLLRHRRDGFLFLPYNWRRWPQAEQAWLKESFVGVGYLEPAESMANFRRIIERLRTRSTAPILIYNVSSIVAGERVHTYVGMEDLLSTRIRRFNLELIELSQEIGISIIDVDAIVARAGAEAVAYDMFHLNAQGCRMVAEEVVRVVEDLGCLPSAGDAA